jgi:hypothetical protein
MNECAYCWLKGVESNYTDGDFVQDEWGYRDEIRDSYFSNSYNHSPGATDSDIFIVFKTSGTLVENNIIERAHSSILINWGAAGNVIAYNYLEGSYSDNGSYFLTENIGMHGAHPQFNLLEGNVTPNINPDEIWGSSAFNTIFRNWAEGTTLQCMPDAHATRGTVTCSPFGQAGGTGVNAWWAVQYNRAINITHLATHYNIVGNVAGSANDEALLEYMMSGYPMSHTAMIAWPSAASYDAATYNMAFGYGEAADPGGTSSTGCSGSTNPPCHSTAAYSTVFLHGNYTLADGAIDNWVSGVTQALPHSFYHTSKPLWWGMALPYPAIGPDVTGGAGANGHAGLIPAQNCYFNVMGGSEGGAGSPLTFNADQCYPLPPPAVVATPH